MHRGLLVFLTLLLVAPAAAQSADAILRYPSQVTFTVWGAGETYNEVLVEAAPGDALDTVLDLKFIARENTLEAPQNAEIEALLMLDEPMLLGATNVTIPAGDGSTIPVRLNLTLPPLEQGEYELRFTMVTGSWDPPENNNPNPVILRVGEPIIAEDNYKLTAGLVAGPIALVLLAGGAVWARKGVPGMEHITARWERAGTWWAHMDPDNRRRTTAWGLAAIVATLLLLTIIAARGITIGWRGFAEGLAIGLGAAVMHAATRIIRDRTIPKNWQFALRTGLILAGTAIWWQQLADVTDVVRWPQLAQLDSFLVIGVQIGAIYALIALGYTMVYGVLKFINFAHGDIFTWGAYLAWVLMVDVVQWPFFIAAAIAIAGTGLLGATLERVAYRPLRGGPRLAPLVTAIAASLVLQSLAQFFFGAQTVTYTMEGSRYAGSSLQMFFDRQFSFLGATVDVLSIVILLVSIALMWGLHTFVHRSRMGQAMRATADSMETARTIGIDVDRVVRWTFVIGSALAAVGGIFFGLEFGLKPTMGLLVGIKAFTAAVVGGIGNIYGAFLGGFLIGIVENVGGQFVAPQFQKVITFVLLIVFLLWRPQGILGKEVDRR